MPRSRVVRAPTSVSVLAPTSLALPKPRILKDLHTAKCNLAVYVHARFFARRIGGPLTVTPHDTTVDTPRAPTTVVLVC